MADLPFSRHRRKLGEMLLAESLITQDQLNRALEIQRATREPLGRVLLNMGVVDQEHVAQFISEQIGSEFVRLLGMPLPDEVLQLLPASEAARLQAIPISADNGTVTVAMVDPFDVIAVDEIRRRTGLAVDVAVTTLADFQYGLNQYAKVEDPMEALIRDLPQREVVDELKSLDQIRRDASAQPVVRLVNQVIEEAVRQRATDIHIEPQGRHVRVRYRVDGVLLTKGQLPDHVLPQVVSRIKIMALMDIAERRQAQDGSFQTNIDRRPIDVRVSTIPSFFGEKVVMRLLDKSAPIYDLDKLGLATGNMARLSHIIKKPQGIFLLTGPTGSGKTTTLYGILNQLNNEQVNVLTIEDPVEYQIAGITQVQVNPRAGVTFAAALRHFLRQDPDIMMVGEIRDEETARIAVQAALTGHFVLSTLHTNDAMGAITRLVDMKIEPYLVASSLEGVAAQRLVRVLCPRCRRPDPYSLEELRAKFGESSPPGEYFRPVGCDFCAYTGYRGRSAIFEIAQITDEIRPLIINRAPHHAMKERAVMEGMRTLFQDGLEKASRGITSLAEVERVVQIERDNGES